MMKHYIACVAIAITSLNASLSISQTLNERPVQEMTEVTGKMSAIINGLPTELLASGPGDRGGGDKSKFDQALKIRAERPLDDETVEQIRTIMTREQNFLSGLFKAKIESGQFKRDLLQILENSQFLNYIRSQSARRTLQDLLSKGLVEDIKNTPYKINRVCVDDLDQKSKFLVTENHRGGANYTPSEICINPENFFSFYLNQRQIIGLTDEDYTFKVTRLEKYFTFYPLWQFFGLFLHDHARHFGIKDEDHSLAVELAIAAFRMPSGEMTSQKLVIRQPYADERDFLVNLNLDPNSECGRQAIPRIEYSREGQSSTTYYNNAPKVPFVYESDFDYGISRYYSCTKNWSWSKFDLGKSSFSFFAGNKKIPLGTYSISHFQKDGSDVKLTVEIIRQRFNGQIKFDGNKSYSFIETDPDFGLIDYKSLQVIK